MNGASSCQTTSSRRWKVTTAAVLGDLPGLGEIGQDGTVRPEAGKAGKDEAGEVAVGVVQVREERVDAKGRTHDRLDIAMRGGLVVLRERAGEGEPSGSHSDDADGEHSEEGPTSAGLQAATAKAAWLIGVNS